MSLQNYLQSFDSPDFSNYDEDWLKSGYYLTQKFIPFKLRLRVFEVVGCPHCEDGFYWRNNLELFPSGVCTYCHFGKIEYTWNDTFYDETLMLRRLLTFGELDYNNRLRQILEKYGVT